jgi:hypothetical protein
VEQGKTFQHHVSAHAADRLQIVHELERFGKMANPLSVATAGQELSVVQQTGRAPTGN